jgi:hypothetical protein
LKLCNDGNATVKKLHKMRFFTIKITTLLLRNTQILPIPKIKKLELMLIFFYVDYINNVEKPHAKYSNKDEVYICSSHVQYISAYKTS